MFNPDGGLLDTNKTSLPTDCVRSCRPHILILRLAARADTEFCFSLRLYLILCSYNSPTTLDQYLHD